jgi:hypothetical protein
MGPILYDLPFNDLSDEGSKKYFACPSGGN